MKKIFEIKLSLFFAIFGALLSILFIAIQSKLCYANAFCDLNYSFINYFTSGLMGFILFFFISYIFIQILGFICNLIKTSFRKNLNK